MKPNGNGTDRPAQPFYVERLTDPVAARAIGRRFATPGYFASKAHRRDMLRRISHFLDTRDPAAFNVSSHAASLDYVSEHTLDIVAFNENQRTVKSDTRAAGSAPRPAPIPPDHCFITPASCVERLSDADTFCMAVSRQRKYPDGRWKWVRALVKETRRRLNAGKTPVTSPGTICYDIVRHLSRKIRRIIVFTNPSEFADFLAEDDTDTVPVLPVVMLGLLKKPAMGVRDDWVFRLASERIALAVRRGGTWQRRFERALTTTQSDRPRRLAAFDPAGISETGVNATGNAALIQHGCEIIRFTNTKGGGNHAATQTASHPAVPSLSVFPIRNAPPFTEPYFAHHVSGRAGPWPMESDDTFLSRLIAGSERSRCDAVGALMEVIRTRTLFAGIGGIASGHRAVCFTELTISDSRALMKYDPARKRHLFSGCAVCIRRRALEPFVQPVLYGDALAAAALDETERYRFQLYSKAGDAPDRRAEREWRSRRNINLSAFQSDDVFLLVDTEQDAMLLASGSPWAVVWSQVLFDMQKKVVPAAGGRNDFS